MLYFDTSVRIRNCLQQYQFIMSTTGSTHVALEIWDIGGQTIGSTMLSNYIFGAHVRILMIIHVASLN